MLLRRISKHVKDQNWFAVALDFFIVVAGILIAFQITNWSEGRQANIRETAVLKQLAEEFTQIKVNLEKQIAIRTEYVDKMGAFIKILEDETQDADDVVIKTALENATATGRRPPQSAAYLQLMASGGLTTLSDENLQRALVRYDVRLQRDAFIHPELMQLVVEELSSNRAVDYDFSSITRRVAEIDDDVGQRGFIRAYDLEKLRPFENRYETIYVMHTLLLGADEVQLDLAQEILDRISGEVPP